MRDDFEEQEVVISRHEFAGIVAEQVAVISKGMKDKERIVFCEMMARFCALLMVEMFDKGKIDKLEVEE